MVYSFIHIFVYQQFDTIDARAKKDIAVAVLSGDLASDDKHKAWNGTCGDKNNWHCLLKVHITSVCTVYEIIAQWSTKLQILSSIFLNLQTTRPSAMFLKLLVGELYPGSISTLHSERTGTETSQSSARKSVPFVRLTFQHNIIRPLGRRKSVIF